MSQQLYFLAALSGFLWIDRRRGCVAERDLRVRRGCSPGVLFQYRSAARGIAEFCRAGSPTNFNCRSCSGSRLVFGCGQPSRSGDRGSLSERDLRLQSGRRSSRSQSVARHAKRASLTRFEALTEIELAVARRIILQRTKLGVAELFIERSGLKAERVDESTAAAPAPSLGFRRCHQRRTNAVAARRLRNEQQTDVHPLEHRGTPEAAA